MRNPLARMVCCCMPCMNFMLSDSVIEGLGNWVRLNHPITQSPSFTQILPQSLDALLQNRNRFRIREAHVLLRAVVAEIEPGRDGDAGFFEQVPAELVAVIREPLAVGIYIEGAL